MWRMCLAAIAVLIVSPAGAQVAGDPEAAAPVVYSSAAPPDSGCSSNIVNADGSPVISCTSAAAQDDNSDFDADDYADDYGAPAYDVAPDFYPGVSLLPVDYWDPAFGWPYVSYAYFGYGYGWPYGVSFGFGWPSWSLGWPYWGFGGPYWGFNWYGGGHWWGHHHHHYAWGGGHGGHHHGGWTPYHGPYRYYGHGHYADQMRDSTRLARADRTTPVSRALSPGTDRARVATASAALRTPTNSMATRRPVLASASYVAAQRGYANHVSAYRVAPSVGTRPAYRNGAGSSYSNGSGTRPINRYGANQAYRVTSIPNRSYASPAYRGNASTHSATPYAYAAPHATNVAPRPSYAMPRAGGYSAVRSAPPIRASSGGTVAHASSGAHANGGSARRH